MQFNINDWGTSVFYYTSYSDGKYVFDNPYTEDIFAMVFMPQNSDKGSFTFPYDSDLFDYYLLGTVTSGNADIFKSSFKPTVVAVDFLDYSTGKLVDQVLTDVNVYDIDGALYCGFGFSAKIDFSVSNNIGINHIFLSHDKDGLGSKPAGLVAEFGILAISKATSESEINQRILNKLSEMQESITDSIGSAADQVTDAIENQYGMIPGESFGVQDLTSQVEEKLGVLSFGADTLNNFLGLFQASNAGSTVLTFPGFTIDVQGESYQVWNDMQFDLAFLEENFGVLIIAVRTVTVLCVWLAVLGYLVKAYEHLVNNKG